MAQNGGGVTRPMKLRTQLFLIFSLIIIVVVGTIGCLVYRQLSDVLFEQLRSTLTAYASSAAMLIDAQRHAALSGSGDAHSPYYAELLATLRKFMAIDPRIAECYTMVASGKPTTWKFVMDAAEARDRDGDGVISDNERQASLGEEYDVSPYPEMQKAFKGARADKEINQDKWGWWLSAYAPVIDTRGKAIAIVGLDISAATIRGEQARLQSLILGISIAFLLLGLILANAYAYRLTAPVHAMVAAAKEIGKGNYDHRVETAVRNEIGFLASTMNSMAENIRRSFDKLSTLHRTANIFASTMDLEQALRISLNLAIEVTRSSKGVVFLVDRTDTRVEIAISEGIEGLRLLDDQCHVGGASFAVRLAGDRAAQVRQWLDMTGCTQCLPLTIKENTRGFFLLNPEIRDEEFLATLMNQISFAIENARLFHDAITDGLTGLFLKRYFQIQLDTEIGRSRRHVRDLALLMLDIDHFKQINDTHGHLTGDRVLQEIARRIKGCVRQVDVVARCGGEEFAVILPETSLDQAGLVSERIRHAVGSRAFRLGALELAATVSIGACAIKGGELVAADELVNHADAALYRAKEGGRNRVVLFRG